MFIWRIGTNSLPTKDNLLKRININDPSCLLCGFEVETCCHLFFGCPVAKAIWHSSCWGFKADKHHMSACMDIIKLILDPSQALCPSEDQWLIPLNMALVLDEIWHLRNQVSFQEGQVDIPNSIKRINFKFLEFSTLLESKKPSAAPVVFRWEAPPLLHRWYLDGSPLLQDG